MEKGNPGVIRSECSLCFLPGLGILFEYILKIEMGFYNIPIVNLLVALLVACFQNGKLSF